MRLFDPNIRWFKGNTHLHTTCSDGHLDPEAAMDLYRSHGYDFLVLTDHWRTAPEQWHDGLLALSGVELNYELANQVVHIVGIGLTHSMTDADSARAHESPNAGIQFIRQAGGRAILAHPSWSLNTVEVLRGLQGLSALEIYNTVSGRPWNAGRAYAGGFADVAATQGLPYNLVASDDTHFYQGDACRAFIRVNASELTREALLEAFDAGRYYASLGPEIRQIELGGGEIHIRCSPVDTITFFSNLPWVSGRCVAGDGLTEARYTCQQGERFVRAELTDRQGRTAYTHPLVF